MELKRKWSNYCTLSAAGNDNANNNDDNIIFPIKDIKLYVSVVTLSVRDNQKLTKLLSKGFEASAYWNEYKTKSGSKNTANEYRYFLDSHFAGVSRLFVLFYSNEDNHSKRFITRRYYLPKRIINSLSSSSTEKNFYDQPIDFDIKQYEEIRKLTTGQGEDYTT